MKRTQSFILCCPYLLLIQRKEVKWYCACALTNTAAKASWNLKDYRKSKKFSNSLASHSLLSTKNLSISWVKYRLWQSAIKLNRSYILSSQTHSENAIWLQYTNQQNRQELLCNLREFSTRYKRNRENIFSSIKETCLQTNKNWWPAATNNSRKIQELLAYDARRILQQAQDIVISTSIIKDLGNSGAWRSKCKISNQPLQCQHVQDAS